MCRIGDTVLLKGAVDGVPGEARLGAERFIGQSTKLAGETRAVEPLDADVVADFEFGDQLALGDDDPCALVAADEGQFTVQRPVAFHRV